MEAIDDVAERRFSWLLTQRGCTFVREHELERVMQVRGPRPDFYVQSDAGPFLAEVKAFPGPYGAMMAAEPKPRFRGRQR